MVVLIRNRKLLELVRKAYAQAGVREGELLVAGNTRILLEASHLVLESACPIPLDRVIGELRRVASGEPSGPAPFVWVRGRTGPGGRWRGTRPEGPAQGPAGIPEGEAP